MARTTTGGRFRRRATATRHLLRREVPSTVAVLADQDDFAAMRRYASFRFPDHAVYLRRLQGLLRALRSRGVPVTVALFHPEQYAEFCADAGLDPDSTTSRARYATQLAAAGPTVPYRGEPLGHLALLLRAAAERQTAWERATDELVRSCACRDCGEAVSRAAFDRASTALRMLLTAAGPGSHHLVCSVSAGHTGRVGEGPRDRGRKAGHGWTGDHDPAGERGLAGEGAPREDAPPRRSSGGPASAPLVAVLRVEAPGDGSLSLAESEAALLCTVLACAIAGGRPGGLVLRTTVEGVRDTVRGWTLRDGWPQPLTEAEVFAAYCTDADTGEPVPPEPGVEYRAGLPLPDPGAPAERGTTERGPTGGPVCQDPPTDRPGPSRPSDRPSHSPRRPRDQRPGPRPGGQSGQPQRPRPGEAREEDRRPGQSGERPGQSGEGDGDRATE